MTQDIKSAPSLFGFLICNKPRELTSRDLVNIVQRRIRPTKVGHCGTLDPLAEGVLVLGVGPAVRLTSFVQECPKRYIAAFRLGASSATGDLENGYDEHPDLAVPNLQQLQQAAVSLVGDIQQTPPAYSAIWVDGQRAYQRARRGEQVDMPQRTVTIHQLEIVSYDYPNVLLDITCGSGTYIRSLGIDLAKAVGSIAVMTALQRTAIGPFLIEDAISVEQLRDDSLQAHVVAARTGVEHLPVVTVDDADSGRLGNGLPLASAVTSHLDAGVGPAIAATRSGQLRAILQEKPRGWCPVKVFPIREQ